jgi:hypothetical protein
MLLLDLNYHANNEYSDPALVINRSLAITWLFGTIK